MVNLLIVSIHNSNLIAQLYYEKLKNTTKKLPDKPGVFVSAWKALQSAFIRPEFPPPFYAEFQRQLLP